MSIRYTQKLILAGILLALALLLPFVTGSTPLLGRRFLPMHIPVIICGFICGPKQGTIIGFIAPLLRSVLFGVPPLMPVATAMAFELGTYGLISGLLYRHLKQYGVILASYISLFSAMIIGRIVLGIINVILFGFQEASYSFELFISGAFLNAIPGIILQIIVIPVIIIALEEFNTSRA